MVISNHDIHARKSIPENELPEFVFALSDVDIRSPDDDLLGSVGGRGWFRWLIPVVVGGGRHHAFG